MPSKKKSSPAAYNDAKTVMDIALEKPGLRYTLQTPGRAVNFKQRCNRYRNLLREMAAEQGEGIPGYRAETAYDILIIRQQDDEGNPSKQGRNLVFDHEELAGDLFDPETGEKIEVAVNNQMFEGGAEE